MAALTVPSAYGPRTAEQAAQAEQGRDRLYGMICAERAWDAIGPSLKRALAAERATIGRKPHLVRAELDRALRNARALVSRLEAAVAASEG